MQELKVKASSYTIEEVIFKGCMPPSGHLVNCFLMERSYFVFAIDQKIVVCNQYGTIVSETTSPVGDLLCCTAVKHSQYTFFQGFYSHNSKELPVKNVKKIDGETEPEGSYSLVRHATFDVSK